MSRSCWFSLFLPHKYPLPRILRIPDTYEAKRKKISSIPKILGGGWDGWMVFLRCWSMVITPLDFRNIRKNIIAIRNIRNIQKTIIYHHYRSPEYPENSSNNPENQEYPENSSNQVRNIRKTLQIKSGISGISGKLIKSSPEYPEN